jgi:hypothetical protein
MMFKYLIIIKIVLLSSVLIMVLWTMRVVDAASVSQFFANLGVQQSIQQGVPEVRQAQEKISTYRLCQSRVHSITWPNGDRIEERVDGMKMTWMAYDPRPRVINYLDMEKWLSQHCELLIQEPHLEDLSRNGYWKYLKIQFVGGKEVEIMHADAINDADLGLKRSANDHSATSVFFVDGKVFRSMNLVDAIASLRSIAQFHPVDNANSSSKAP